MEKEVISTAPIGHVDLIDRMGDDLSVIRAARVSFGRTIGETFDAEGDGRLMRYLLRNGHWSPFEHATLTFRVEAPIFIARQWMRHKSWSFNEVSARYRAVADAFYFPETWRKQSKSNKQASDGALEAPEANDAGAVAQNALRVAWDAYKYLLGLGVAREQARAFLPVGAFTEFYATASIRSILHFIEQRDDPHAQLEIQVLAREVAALTAKFFPHTMLAWAEVRGVTPPTAAEIEIQEGLGLV